MKDKPGSLQTVVDDRTADNKALSSPPHLTSKELPFGSMDSLLTKEDVKIPINTGKQNDTEINLVAQEEENISKLKHSIGGMFGIAEEKPSKPTESGVVGEINRKNGNGRPLSAPNLNSPDRSTSAAETLSTMFDRRRGQQNSEFQSPHSRSLDEYLTDTSNYTRAGSQPLPSNGMMTVQSNKAFAYEEGNSQIKTEPMRDDNKQNQQKRRNQAITHPMSAPLEKQQQQFQNHTVLPRQTISKQTPPPVSPVYQQHPMMPNQPQMQRQNYPGLMMSQNSIHPHPVMHQKISRKLSRPNQPRQTRMPIIQDQVSMNSSMHSQPPIHALGPSAPIIGPDAGYRPLNVRDALSYLDQVKYEFSNQPDVYNRFLDIMKDFKSQAIDTLGVIQRVSTLFRDHPNLVQGFNTFLPPGYRIDCSIDHSDMNSIRVTTPMGTVTQPSINGGRLMNRQGLYYYQNVDQGINMVPYQNMPYQSERYGMLDYSYPVEHYHHEEPMQKSNEGRKGTIEFNYAINYVNKIKNRFYNQPDIYKRFLEILQTYRRDQRPIQDVYAQVTLLFKDAQDLLDDFKQFLPDSSGSLESGSLFASAPSLPPLGNFAPPPGQTSGSFRDKRKQSTENEISNARTSKRLKYEGAKQNMEYDTMPEHSSLVAGTSEPLAPNLETAATSEELEFFDKVRKFVGNQQTYHEFLKVLNLFSQDILDKSLLIERVEGFLGQNRDLMEWFKAFVRWEDQDFVIDNIPAPRPRVDLTLCDSYGPSYRLLPKVEAQLPCSGRDELCWEILNDDWVSHPTWASEDSGFVAHKKNQYEEVMHKAEEERYEYDSNIEANLRTTQLLEPIAQQISNMSQEEKCNYKLPPGLHGTSTSIYQKVIKKIYGAERGKEVIEALLENPCVAVPVVLKRLKEKDEEWRRAQREWNKVWREMENQAYWKSLDHQGITFKTKDKKHITNKSLLSEIDTLRRQQRESLIDPNHFVQQYQFKHYYTDFSVLLDACKIILCFVENVSSLTTTEVTRMEGFLMQFVILFFEIDPIIFENDKKALTEVLRKQDKKTSYNATKTSTPNGGIATAAQGNEFGEISSAKETAERAGESWMKSRVLPVETERKRQTYDLFANTNIYVFFRILHILYERLLQLKEIQGHVDPPRDLTEPNPIAVQLGLASAKETKEEDPQNGQTKYQKMLSLCELMVKGEMEQSQFEESMRNLYFLKGYKLYTVDKLVTAISKQIHTIVTDTNIGEIVLLFEKDRQKPTTSTRQRIIYRTSVESLVSSDEFLYKINWYPKEKALTIQLLLKEDITIYQSKDPEERYKYYIESYTMSKPTEGVPLDRFRTPFLERNIPIFQSEEEASDFEKSIANSIVTSGLELFISIGTYRIFYGKSTEDVFVRCINSTALVAPKKQSLKKRWKSLLQEWQQELNPNEIEVSLREADLLFYG